LQAVDHPDHEQNGAPPDVGVQVEEHYRILGWMKYFPNSSRGNENAVHQQGYPDKKPNGNAAVISHVVTRLYFLRERFYQKMMFSTTKTAATTLAQNRGFS
jgi:hypothetical protein